MFICDTCGNLEHLMCRGLLKEKDGDHVCLICLNGVQEDLKVYFLIFVT